MHDMPIPFVKQEDSTDTRSNVSISGGAPNSVSIAGTYSDSSITGVTAPTSTTTAGKSSAPATRLSIGNMDEERRKLFKGVRYVVDHVAPTLGPSGASAVIEVPVRPFTKVVDDGRSVAEALYLEDPIENMGVNIAKEVAVQADRESADGTTTATVIMGALVDGAESTGQSGIALKRQLDEALPRIIAAIDSQKTVITTEDIQAVAMTASGDEEISHIFNDIYKEIGKDGIIELDNSNLPTTHYEFTEGVRLRNAGWLGAYSSTEPGKAVYKNPKILISKEKITTVEQLEPLVRKLSEGGVNELVIYCDEIDVSVASRLALTHINGGFKTLIIPSPTLWKDWLFEDTAALTGATPVDYANGKTFKNLAMSDLGTCDKIITTKDETRLLGTREISAHIEALKEAAKTDDQQLIRIAWLSTKAAVLKVGANSENELSYKRAKVQDAIGACRLALEDGVVRGGGMCLLEISKEAYPELIKAALLSPFEQMLLNNGGIAFNVPEEVVDAAKVTKNSVTAAFSIAGTLLTVNTAIPMRRQKQDINPFGQ